MKKPVAEQQSKLTPEAIKKFGRRFAFIPLILGILVAQWKGTKVLIPTLIVGAILIPISLVIILICKKYPQKK